MLTVVLGLLAAAQPAPPGRGPRVEDLPNGQFRIIVANRGATTDPAALANAMLRSEEQTRTEAARRCAGNRWEMISTFACRAPAAPATTPPAGG